MVAELGRNVADTQAPLRIGAIRVRLDVSLQGSGVLVTPVYRFLQNLLGVVTRMIVRDKNKITVDAGGVRLQTQRGTIRGDGLVESALGGEDIAETLMDLDVAGL